jgi:competence protein ComGC
MNLLTAMHSRSRSQSAIRIRPSETDHAFTRSEMLAVLAVLSLLAVIVTPALAHDRVRAARLLCASNLRQIGMALHQWGNDHEDRPPWEVSVNEGGTYAHPLGVNTWVHFSWLSNELASPKIVFCPSDTGRPAEDFTGSINGGYLNSAYRNNATSYLLSHAQYESPFTVIVADRNMGQDQVTSCSRFPAVTSISLSPLSLALAWNTNLHNQAGNMLRLDGSIEEYSNSELLDAFTTDPISDRPSFHMLKPR